MKLCVCSFVCLELMRKFNGQNIPISENFRMYYCMEFFSTKKLLYERFHFILCYIPVLTKKKKNLLIIQQKMKVEREPQEYMRVVHSHTCKQCIEL